jgi:hypothetical protein
MKRDGRRPQFRWAHCKECGDRAGVTPHHVFAVLSAVSPESALAVRAATGVESRIRRCGQPAHRFIVTDLVVAFPPDLAVPLWTFEEKSASFPAPPLRR